MKLAAPIAAALLISMPATAQSYPDEVRFAQARIGVWQAEAVTGIDDRFDPPVIREIRCAIRTNGVQLLMMRTGEVAVDFRGISEIDADGAEQSFGPIEMRAITLGSQTWEARPVAVNALPYRFTDVPYPRTPGDDIVLTVFRGYSAVRRPDGPWYRPDILADALAQAASVDIAYRVWNEDGRTETIRHFYAPLTGLAQAMTWCQAQMHSEVALRLHPER